MKKLFKWGMSSVLGKFVSMFLAIGCFISTDYTVPFSEAYYIAWIFACMFTAYFGFGIGYHVFKMLEGMHYGDND